MSTGWGRILARAPSARSGGLTLVALSTCAIVRAGQAPPQMRASVAAQRVVRRVRRGQRWPSQCSAAPLPFPQETVWSLAASAAAKIVCSEVFERVWWSRPGAAARRLRTRIQAEAGGLE